MFADLNAWLGAIAVIVIVALALVVIAKSDHNDS